MQCKGVTKNNNNCKKKAVKDGYCVIHHPENIKRQDKLLLQKNRTQEVLELIEETVRAKGWSYRLDSYDSKSNRYATIIVRKTVSTNNYSPEEIVGALDISVIDGVKVSCTNTSFHGYGLQDLQASISDEIENLPWLESKKKKRSKSPKVDSVYKLINRFHLVATQMKRRYNARETIKISDEYDVQDLFHSLLKIDFDDVRPEEYSPSRGGASSRLDFLLKKEKIVIEVKMASKTLTDKKIGEQLIIDIERYREHPDCDTLICFVYDPEAYIRNPSGIEEDLSRKDGKLVVKVLVVPK